jgi:hypothetical protein
MSKKEQVNLRKTEDFEEVDRVLSEAMALLDETNERVGQVLSGVPEEESAAARAKATGEAPAGEYEEDGAPAGEYEEDGALDAPEPVAGGETAKQQKGTDAD